MSNTMKIILILLFIVSCSSGGSTQTAGGGGAGGGGGGISLSLIKKATLTIDAEGGSARPEIVATADRVFVVYLGNIRTVNNRTFNVKIFDSNLDTLIATKTLITTTSDYGGPTDIRIAPDGQYLYAFYETHKTTSQTTAINYLWGATYRLDDDFERVAYTSTPIASSKPMAELQDGGELLDDPAPLVGPNSVFVITRIKYSLSMAGMTVYRVREFNKENLQKLNEFDLDLSNVADGRGRVTSLLYWNNTTYIALATTVSNQIVQEDWDDSAQSDIILVSMKPDWTYDPQKDVRFLAAEPGDRENYITGLKTDGSYLFITYKQSIGIPPSGEHRAIIKVFNQAFNLLQNEQVKSAVWGEGGGEIRPSLEVRGNRVFSGQSGGQGIGTGNAEVYVYRSGPSTGTGYMLDAFGGVHNLGTSSAIGPASSYFGWDIARDLNMYSSSGYYVLDGYGGIHAGGTAPSISTNAYFGWDIARAIASALSGTGVYVLDGYGGVHAQGGASVISPASTYFGWDIAKDIVLVSSTAYYVLDGYGGIHMGGTATPISTTAYFGWDIARGIARDPVGTGVYVLDGYGGVHAQGGVPIISPASSYFGWDIARDIIIQAPGTGYYVLDGFGGVHCGGSATEIYPTPYWGWDIARAIGLP